MKKTTTDSWNSKIPKLTVNPALNKYGDMNLFPGKLAKAKEELKNVELPSRPVSVSESEQ